MTSFQKYCFEYHDRFKQFGFDRYSKHVDLMSVLEKLSCKQECVGYSVEQASIHCLRLGKGAIKILAWSQMHGDESTATGALLDCINFLENSDDEFQTERSTILENVSLHLIPMLNPDGAERWQRTNALGIDLNRDAARQVCPESKVLQAAFDKIRPDYCFNLHDQESYYTAGMSNIPATISLLAPPIKNNILTENRLKAIQLVNSLFTMLQDFIPNGVGKWNDEYEARAFGEHFQTLGAATILLETGGYPNDPMRYMGRKLNFTALLYAFLQIAKQNFSELNCEQYNSIPLNMKARLFDLILRNVIIEKQGFKFKCDLGYRKTSCENGTNYSWSLDEIGDLSCFAGYKVVDCGSTDELSWKQVINYNFIVSKYCQS